MPKSQLPPSTALYPTPVVLVSCTDKKKSKSNIVTVAWCGVVCSNPPLISISLRPSRYSNKLIREAREFVVNIPSKDLLKKTDLCGTISGRDEDKFKLSAFTEIPSSKISSGMIKECPVNIECRLREVMELGTHDIFMGEVVAVHADEKIVGKNGVIDYDKAAPFVYNQGEYWDLGRKIGHYGFSRG